LATGRGQENQGKLESLTTNRLQDIKDLGIDYLWLTGLLEHASKKNTDMDGVKGEAGSYFAVHDSWDVQSDLGGLSAFEELLKRAHEVGLRVIIDLIPNHTARVHRTDVLGKCGIDFGFRDRIEFEFDPSNSYYYIQGNAFIPPKQDPISGTDFIFDADIDQPGIQLESPAKVTGNDIFSASPSIEDWYETAKLNYGWDYQQRRGYFDPTPATWFKVLDIANYWLSKGVDGFRVDFAHSVPIEFWQFFASRIRMEYPNAFLLAEAYETDFRMKLPGFSYDALLRAGFDSVYSSESYWKMRHIAENQSSLRDTGLPGSSRAFYPQMIDSGYFVTHYMENHDEIRLASRFFSKYGSIYERARLGWAMTVFLGLLPGNLLIHGGQELEEDASVFGLFAGDIGKTSIFDYVYQSRVLDWSTGNISSTQENIYNVYKKLLDIKGRSPFDLRNTKKNPSFIDLMPINARKNESQWISAYLRYRGNKRYLVIINTDPSNDHEFTVHFTDQMDKDSLGILATLNIPQNDKRIRVRDILLDPNWEAHDPALGGVGIPGWVFYRSGGIPSGLYLGKIPRASARVLEIADE
jgi:glycosidase